MAKNGEKGSDRSLGDPDIYPSDEVLASHLGRTKAAFDAMLEFNQAEYPDIEERWKYYNDGKSWLFNVARKKKTLYWLSIGEGWFRATFYLRPEGGEALLASDLPDEYKDQYRSAEGKKMRGVTVVVKTKKDLAAYRELLAIKLATT
jgi:hypothetical protein